MTVSRQRDLGRWKQFKAATSQDGEALRPFLFSARKTGIGFLAGHDTGGANNAIVSGK
jgi:hypothetical protein